MEMIEIHLMEMVLTWPDECYQIVNCVFATSIKLVNTLMKYNVQEILVSYHHDHMGEDRTPRWFAMMKFILLLLSFMEMIKIHLMEMDLTWSVLSDCELCLYMQYKCIS